MDGQLLSSLPFTPQHFEIGGLLPYMLYMARWGHRRGRGNFVGSLRTEGQRWESLCPQP